LIEDCLIDGNFGGRRVESMMNVPTAASSVYPIRRFATAFLTIAIAPLNEFLAGLPDSYDAKSISAVQIMRKKANHVRRR
jgi:hypothetical protein